MLCQNYNLISFQKSPTDGSCCWGHRCLRDGRYLGLPKCDDDIFCQFRRQKNIIRYAEKHAKYHWFLKGGINTSSNPQEIEWERQEQQRTQSQNTIYHDDAWREVFRNNEAS